MKSVKSEQPPSPLKGEQPSLSETPAPSLNDLKAAVYDKIAIREAHEREIQKIHQEIGKLNHQIADMIRKEEAEK